MRNLWLAGSRKEYESLSGKGASSNLHKAIRMSLVNGSKASAAEVGEKGDFKRVESGFRARIGPQEQYPSEGKSLCTLALDFGLWTFDGISIQ